MARIPNIKSDNFFFVKQNDKFEFVSPVTNKKSFIRSFYKTTDEGIKPLLDSPSTNRNAMHKKQVKKKQYASSLPMLKSTQNKMAFSPSNIRTTTIKIGGYTMPKNKKLALPQKNNAALIYSQQRFQDQLRQTMRMYGYNDKSIDDKMKNHFLWRPPMQ